MQDSFLWLKRHWNIVRDRNRLPIWIERWDRIWKKQQKNETDLWATKEHVNLEFDIPNHTNDWRHDAIPTFYSKKAKILAKAPCKYIFLFAVIAKHQNSSTRWRCPPFFNLFAVVWLGTTVSISINLYSPDFPSFLRKA
jgi:hypothetical protein